MQLERGACTSNVKRTTTTKVNTDLLQNNRFVAGLPKLLSEPPGLSLYRAFVGLER